MATAKRVAFCNGCVMPSGPLDSAELPSTFDKEEGELSDLGSLLSDEEMADDRAATEERRGRFLSLQTKLMMAPKRPLRFLRSMSMSNSNTDMRVLPSTGGRTSRATTNGSLAPIQEVKLDPGQELAFNNAHTVTGASFSPSTRSRLANLTRHGSLNLDGGAAKNGGLFADSGLHKRPTSLRSNLRPAEFIRQRLQGSRRVRNRLVQKHGECNIALVNIPKIRRKYFSDIFTTLVDVRWRWCLLIFALGFLLSWLLFSVLYYLVILAHGDMLHADDAPDVWEPCIAGARSWTSVFIFSVVTQHTIGYGKRYPTERCPEVLVLMCLQAMVGVMIQTLMAGVVFAKLARPKKRAETLIFSKKAVICMRDSELCLLFRVGDMRRSQLAEAHVRLQMIKKRITAEGELLPFFQFDMNVGYDDGLDRVFVVWPIVICHVIDERSPLYNMTAQDLQTARFEIIVILEGVVQSTGSCTQAKTSYLPNEVLWGHRFEKLVTYQRENGEYRIDFSRFHNTYPIQIPTVSAKTLNDLREAGLKPEEGFQTECAEEIENEGATPYSTIQPPQQINRPTIVPAGFSRPPPPSAHINDPDSPEWNAWIRKKLSRIAEDDGASADTPAAPLIRSDLLGRNPSLGLLRANAVAPEADESTPPPKLAAHSPVQRKASYSNRGHAIG